jgi:hypothetical protein
VDNGIQCTDDYATTALALANPRSLARGGLAPSQSVVGSSIWRHRSENTRPVMMSSTMAHALADCTFGRAYTLFKFEGHELE